MKICVLSSESSWHFQDLQRAAGNDHLIENLEFGDLGATVGCIDNGSFQSIVSQLETYDCIFVRAMPAGSLQQVVFRMDVLLELERRGVRIVNPPRCIETCVDKYLALTKLEAAGILVPPTAVSQTVPLALQQFEYLGGDVVVKPIFGSMGRGIQRVTNTRAATELFQHLTTDQQVIYQQKFIDHGGTDMRLLVVGDHVFGMRRTHPNHWITNISRGGIGSPLDASPLRDIALSSARGMGCEFVGIDMALSAEDSLFVIEANSSPSWRETQKFAHRSVSRLILQLLISDA